MKKKTIAITSVVLVGVFVLLVAGGLLAIDPIARVATRKAVAYALGVPTVLEAMDIGIVGGTVQMDGLEVSNPEGFITPHFMSLGQGRVALTLGSLMKQQVELPELTLSGISVNLERRGGNSNYGVILENLQRLGSETAPAEQAEKDTEGKQFIVRRISIRDVAVNATLLPVGGELSRVPIRVERIELTDVGTGPGGGVPLEKLSAIIAEAILAAVAQKAGDLLPGEMANELRGGLAQLGGLGQAGLEVVGEVTRAAGDEVKRLEETGRKMIESLGEGAEPAGKTVDEIGKTVEKGFGGLLGGKKKNEKSENKNGG